MNEGKKYEFRKYEHMGAYHWLQAHPAWRNASYNAPLVARYDVMMRHIPPTAQTVLDVGCGDGYLIHLLHQSGFSRVVGMDNNSLAVRLAKHQLRQHDHITSRHLFISSTYNLPLSAHSFDCVVMADVIEHFEKIDIGRDRGIGRRFLESFSDEKKINCANWILSQGDRVGFPLIVLSH